ncbi:MAG: UbiA family prenyltransferase [Planctomycetota bacterium]|jgi:4-hydroxybenzoate polyprenyltransferase
MSAFIAANGLPGLRQILLIIGALIMARSCAMSFNRLVDAKYDISNPRTDYRIGLQNLIGRSNLWIFTVFCAILFIVFAAGLNLLSLLLSPVALLIIFGYSYTKRFSNLSHFALGLALAFSPIGAWIGVKGEIEFKSRIIFYTQENGPQKFTQAIFHFAFPHGNNPYHLYVFYQSWYYLFWRGVFRLRNAIL